MKNLSAILFAIVSSLLTGCDTPRDSAVAICEIPEKTRFEQSIEHHTEIFSVLVYLRENVSDRVVLQRYYNIVSGDMSRDEKADAFAELAREYEIDSCPIADHFRRPAPYERTQRSLR